MRVVDLYPTSSVQVKMAKIRNEFSRLLIGQLKVIGELNLTCTNREKFDRVDAASYSHYSLVPK